ncbi:DgyrCDS1545 [Dimorphilus gyrociliatus]|uniref:DgyrCDS1545 n=1 Tax=Dimorphilus gyrociliatus TaxID=2664684 RepID=A0A7I8V7V0_9ANNE|nr:DgyrCDS1545 [Dimorphilus gyrociliatus]
MASVTSMSSAPRSLQNLFAPKTTEMCLRCNARVYQVEKVGPVNGVVFHKQCFRCKQCGLPLSMRTYFTAPSFSKDINKEIYCSKHKPEGEAVRLDIHSLGLKHALSAPKAVDPYNLRHHYVPGQLGPKIDGAAMFIRSAIAGQNARKEYKAPTNMDKHHFPAFVMHAAKAEALRKAQERLEEEFTLEEDELHKQFIEEKVEQDKQIENEVKVEWEEKLKTLQAKFDLDIRERKDSGDKEVMTQKFYKEKERLEEHMTLKRQKKKATMTLRLQEKSQAETSKMIAVQSEKLLQLHKEQMQQTKEEIVVELVEAKERMEADGEEANVEAVKEAIDAVKAMAVDLPGPHPPSCRKRDLYLDASEFEQLDQHVFDIAEKEHEKFTDLVEELTGPCVSDLQKARAIFRWITVKDLNQLKFDDQESHNSDSPMGILRGIKFGTETYHTLFMRICSYAGLACVEIKGHSKSVGYEPGMKIKENFQNTWNAVLLQNDWWPVQCNWGARHLVLNKDAEPKEEAPVKRGRDKIRYQYDEHYFLTDPDEMIQEFWAKDPEWQLLEKPITIEEFEDMPFVRSVFFLFGLEHSPRNTKAIIDCDSKGEAQVKIKVPNDFAPDLIFHYQLRRAEKDRKNETDYKGAKLDRFVFQTISEGFATFNVYLPSPGQFFLEIFANKIDNSHRLGEDSNSIQPFRLKCACKFRIRCSEIAGKMHPLPACSPGEWGPSKAERHFGMKPKTHKTGLINIDDPTGECFLEFHVPRPLYFLIKLRKNDVTESLLQKYVTHSMVTDTTWNIRIQAPDRGQYGLDIYARPEDSRESQSLSHACKYLINVSKLHQPDNHYMRQLSKEKKEKNGSKSPDHSSLKLGRTEGFNQLGMSLLSHPSPEIEVQQGNSLLIEIGAGSSSLKLSCHLTRENENYEDRVSIKDGNKKHKINIGSLEMGTYILTIFGRRKKDEGNSMSQLFTYCIHCTRPSASFQNTGSKKKKSLFK